MNIPGFTKVEAKKPISRIIAGIDGLEKQGKTHFALTAPAPVVFFDIDIGAEDVIDKFAISKEIQRAIFQLPVIIGVNKEVKEKKTIDECEALWEEFKRLFVTALKSKARTIVIDTATEAWELARLAKLGRLAQVMPHQYTAVNSEYRDLIRAAYAYDKNILLLHKLKPKYMNDKRTNKYERAGFSETGFLVQTNLEVYRDEEDGEFSVFIRDYRLDPNMAGETLSGPMCSFPFLASTLLPDTSPEDWE